MHNGLLNSRFCSIYTRVADVLDNESLIKDIQRMVNLCGNTRSFVTRVKHKLHKQHPGLMFGENVLLNKIAKIHTDSECAQKFVETLHRMKEEAKIEYLHLIIHPTSNVIEGTVWSHLGACELANR